MYQPRRPALAREMNVRGLRCRLHCWGDREAPPVLLLHEAKADEPLVAPLQALLGEPVKVIMATSSWSTRWLVAEPPIVTTLSQPGASPRRIRRRWVLERNRLIHAGRH